MRTRYSRSIVIKYDNVTTTSTCTTKTQYYNCGLNNNGMFSSVSFTAPTDSDVQYVSQHSVWNVLLYTVYSNTSFNFFIN